MFCFTFKSRIKNQKIYFFVYRVKYGSNKRNKRKREREREKLIFNHKIEKDLGFNDEKYFFRLKNKMCKNNNKKKIIKTLLAF